MTKDEPNERLLVGLIWANRAAWAALFLFITAAGLFRPHTPNEAAGYTWPVKTIGMSYVSELEHGVWLVIGAALIMSTLCLIPFGVQQAIERSRAAPKP